MIHHYALTVFGLNGRLAKLRRELTEAANAIDQFEEGKVSIDEILQEMRDVFYVWESITHSGEMKDAFKRNNWRDHEMSSDAKLKLAINDKTKEAEHGK